MSYIRQLLTTCLPLGRISGMGHPGKILRAARAALDLSQDDVAAESNYDTRTIARIEAESPLVSVAAVEAVKKVYEGRGIVFHGESPQAGPGLFLPKDPSDAPAQRSKRKPPAGAKPAAVKAKLDRKTPE